MKTERNNRTEERRGFLRAVAAMAPPALLGCTTTAKTRGSQAATRAEPEEAEVTPGEDLMQEHGVLERILLIYEEAARRIENGEQLDLAIVTSAAGIVRRFVESYHEKLEEEFVFPRLQQAGREAKLVAILLAQHQRGRQTTDDIIRMAGGTASELPSVLRRFVRMYRPHYAREDTVVFPAFRSILGRARYREMGEKFEDKEHQLFGEHGFENNVAEVARLETALGIAELTATERPSVRG